MQRYQLSTQAEQNWLSLRRDLDTLARAYNVAWNWSDPGPDGNAGRRRSAIASRARISSRTTAATIRGSWLNRRPARRRPTRGRRPISASWTGWPRPNSSRSSATTTSVTMASTQGPRVTFVADGRDHGERWSADQTMSTRATLQGERLTVATTGHRDNDYTRDLRPAGRGRRPADDSHDRRRGPSVNR